ncbi:glutamic acid-rich protein-like isoform X2 [Syngnathoides biaculeatus]|uniref:glutamic acid-rich protein-like isoform X2 n=1 Tax=Syngnathoides biaculeatus TaxID=300417 RepID=UPI002ADD4207|nr:glutamic acid-rich protein-like isoform X2 [Syngnathoides biaculeatus]
MDRYGDLDLDLECDDGGDVAQKATLFGGIFKKSSKLVEAQDNLSVSSELSKSNDSLNDSAKDKGGMFKGMFKKQPKSSKEPQQVALSQHNPELSDSLDDSKSSKDKSGMLGGILKKPPRRGHARRPSQDLLDIDMSASNNMNENTKESGGMFSGMFKKAPKRTQSQDNLFENDEQSGSSNNPAVNSNAKESAGMFGGMFKKSPKPLKEKTKSQDDLSQSSELSASSENLSEGGAKEKGGLFSGVFKKHKHPAATRTLSQEDLTAASELSDSSDSLAEKSKEKSQGSKENLSEKPKVKQNGFSAMMKNAFYSEKQEKENTDADVSKETTDNSENQAAHKQSKLNMLNPFRSGKEKQSDSSDEDTPSAGEKSSGHKQNGVKGAMSKLNPFKAANKKDTEDNETLKEADRQVEGKQKLKNNAIDRERKQRSETPPLPRRPAQEEKSGTQVQDKAKEKASEDAKDNKDMTSQQRTDKEPPKVPPRKPSQEELRSRAANAQVPKQENQHQNRSEGELLKEDVEVEAATPAENKANKKKPKRYNPFMPRAAAKPASDDEGLKDDDDDEEENDQEQSKEDKKKEDGTSIPEEVKVKKPKRHNPFMPRVKNKIAQRREADAENEGGNRSLFDQLEEFRIDPAQPEDRQDMDGLMEWWNTVESWEDTPQNDDMTEKEEAKAFALTADKVQKGIRVFNKLFSERAESLWQHVIDLNSMADALDKFNKNTKIAQITGGSTSAIGGVATIAGLALAPVTLGTSLIVTAVGLGVATAGGLTSAGAGISNQVNNSMDRKKVEKIVEDYQEKIADLNKCLKFIKQGIENLRRFDLIKMKNNAYNRDFPVLSSSFYEDGAMAGKAILINANEIMRVVQIANVAGSTAARAVQIASMATGVLTGLFVGMDIYFVAKDSKELKKGAKSEFAAKIREVATQLHEGLVELNTIREELQSTSAPLDEDQRKEKEEEEEKKKKKGGFDYDSSEEDEIDRIKKAIKKDLDNREYV